MTTNANGPRFLRGHPAFGTVGESPAPTIFAAVQSVGTRVLSA